MIKINLDGLTPTKDLPVTREMFTPVLEKIKSLNECLESVQESFFVVTKQVEEIQNSMKLFVGLRNQIGKIVKDAMDIRFETIGITKNKGKMKKKRMGIRGLNGKIYKLSQSELIKCIFQRHRTPMTNKQVATVIREKYKTYNIPTTTVGSIIKVLEDRNQIRKVQCSNRPYTWQYVVQKSDSNL